MKKKNNKFKPTNMLQKLNDYTKSISSNKLFIGAMMIFMNIGSRHIEIKLTKSQETLMKNIATEILIFTIAFIGTRDIITAIIITTIFVLLSKFVFNENSKYNILPKNYKQLEKVLDSNNDGKISEKEIENAINILKKANKK
tara:strand:+ start:1781 stop:2206 length:426 start_codon:yes stop_codon:yes gene_type:complete